MAQAIAYLDDIKPYKTSWRVEVHVLHTWKTFTTMFGEIFDMVLSDVKGKMIHASVKRDLLNRFEMLSMYTVEFQKRGLPHAHILLFMDKSCKFPTSDDIDNIISAKIPDKAKDPKLYEVVKDCMIHGPCGAANKDSPYMVDGKCSKFFPKKLVEQTTVGKDGYPIYRRRESQHFVEKGGIMCDNSYVVPYNRLLSLRYRAHINVEWCNQSGSIKYLFKYINKGQDRVAIVVEPKDKNTDTENGSATRSKEKSKDKIKDYFDCRYVSASEAVWRIFKFPIQFRTTPVMKLSYHIPGKQPLFFDGTENVDELLERNANEDSMFMAYLNLNKENEFDFKDMPKPTQEGIDHSNRFITEEKNYNRDNLRKDHDEWVNKMTSEKKGIYDEIIGDVLQNSGGVFFVYGFGGTGKTFMWKTLSAAVRMRGLISVNVASSGTASLLLEGGRTAHSRFGIPINPDDFTTCHIVPNSDLANMLKEASLIIWDEAPMMSRYCFESLDRSLNDVIGNVDGKPFGGKVVVFGGDFRQVLPVIHGAGRAEIVLASLNSSYLWEYCKVLTLTKNMRLMANDLDKDEAEKIKEFSDWLLAVGDGRVS
ncbi:Nucleic acid-binding OB-fold [Arabidopsis thaliana x Arabidopsis arenosa]|uniref:ATP-dependent DNA helicase n=1 Tax=Arabidopsis thaliana x Arabidopsis arenosa TaxID=1240361 RepID=A0A8T1Z079_9BRAS|nr:Nucleic acid-binding OB-fold [Arabidopsis thaliana x Arabidopsis arenosa]